MKWLLNKFKTFFTVGKFATVMMILGVFGIGFMYYILTYTRILTVPVFLSCLLGIMALSISEIYCTVLIFRYIRKKRSLKKINSPVYKKSEKSKRSGKVLQK